MSLAFRCEVCKADPYWSLLRIGDVVVTWACAAHLSDVMRGLQRAHEVTEVIVNDFNKAMERAASR